MRTSRTIIAALSVSALFMGACSEGGDSKLAAFCETHTDDKLEGLDPSNPDEAAQLSDAMAKMEENAPEEIKEDVATTRAGFEVAQSGDVEEMANMDVEEFQAAAQRVEEYAEEHCT
jgi:hypothetical protein